MISLALLYLLTASNHPLEDLQKTFKNKSGFEVNFDQQIIQTLFPNQPEKASGKVTFKKPSQLEWDYLKPEQKKLRFDGRQLTIEQDGQKQKVEGIGSATLQEAFSFLWGETRSSLFKTEVLSAKSFRLKPLREDQVSFLEMKVTITTKNNQALVDKVEIKGRVEDQNHLQFSNWKIK